MYIGITRYFVQAYIVGDEIQFNVCTYKSESNSQSALDWIGILLITYNGPFIVLAKYSIFASYFRVLDRVLASFENLLTSTSIVERTR